MPAASHSVPQLQMELVRSCMVDVLEEFQDEVNSRLMHLQYIITKKFIHQQVSIDDHQLEGVCVAGGKVGVCNGNVPPVRKTPLRR